MTTRTGPRIWVDHDRAVAIDAALLTSIPVAMTTSPPKRRSASAIRHSASL
jgi:hypothetical protein